MPAGESAARMARSAAEAERRYREKAERAAQVAAAYAKGDEGERALAQIVASLGPAGYFPLPDRAIPGKDANIDCLLVGPTGVFVIDAKNWSGTVTVDGRVLRQNGRRRSDEIERLRGQATVVAQILDEIRPTGRVVPVWPVLAFVGSASIGARTPVERVQVLDGPHLVGFVQSLDAALSQIEVEQVMCALMSRLPPRASGRAHLGDKGESQPPDEPVVFLTPWRGHGHQRLYVKDELGFEGGYLDLKTGEVHGTSDAAIDVLRRLLPHYVKDGSPGAFDKEALGAIRRFLSSLLGTKPVRATDQPIIAGYHWRNYGRRRLYVTRLDGAGTNVDLGWYDLNEGRVHAEFAGMEPVVRYCGERYQAVDEARR